MHKALFLLAKIPKGKVTTYGDLARATGSSPRAIGQIMRNNPRPDLYPCYKCVSASGRIHGYDGCLTGNKIDKKVALLRRDRIKIEGGRIDLRKFRHSF